MEDLAQQRIDAGLLIPPLPERTRIELDYLKLLEEPLVLAAPTGLKQLRGQQRVACRCWPCAADHFPAPHRARAARRDPVLLPRRRPDARIGQEAIQMQTIVSLVSAGMGIALVPQSVSNLKRPGVEYRALAEPMPLVETGLAWRRDNRSPVLAAFLELLRKK